MSLQLLDANMVDIPDVGHTVKIEVQGHNGNTSHEGIILHPAAKDHITVKLPNGYNASYPVAAIISVEVTGKVAEVDGSEVNEVTMNESLPRVRIIHTGGTIASKVDYKTGAVIAKFEPTEIVASIPELASIANIDAEKMGNMFSDDIRPQHWNEIAKATKRAFDDGCYGVVITHGTDTLHISSAAMCFAWSGKGERPPGPIAMVGSQRSSDRGSSDASENLIAAVKWAAEGPKPSGECGDSTVVIMHTSSHDGTCSVQPGTGVRKMHSTRRDAFQNVNSQPLAYIDLRKGEPEIIIQDSYQEILDNSNREICQKPTMFSPEVRIAQFIAGPWLHEQDIESVVSNGPQAIVIHGTGLGHLPIDDPRKDAPENTKIWRVLTRCVNRNIPVIVTTQCINGPVDMNVYSKGRKQQDMGLLGHGTTTSPETLVAKVHWLLSNNKSVADLISVNLCGENNLTLME